MAPSRKRARGDGCSATELAAIFTQCVKNKNDLWYPVGKGARRQPEKLKKFGHLLRECQKLSPNWSFKPMLLKAAVEELAGNMKFKDDGVEYNNWVETMIARFNKMFRDTAQAYAKNRRAAWVVAIFGHEGGAQACVTEMFSQKLKPLTEPMEVEVVDVQSEEVEDVEQDDCEEVNAENPQEGEEEEEREVDECVDDDTTPIQAERFAPSPEPPPDSTEPLAESCSRFCGVHFGQHWRDAYEAQKAFEACNFPPHPTTPSPAPPIPQHAQLSQPTLRGCPARPSGDPGSFDRSRPAHVE